MRVIFLALALALVVAATGLPLELIFACDDGRVVTRGEICNPNSEEYKRRQESKRDHEDFVDRYGWDPRERAYYEHPNHIL